MTPKRILTAYNEGRITATSASVFLCEAVLEHYIKEFVQDVPEEVLDILKEEVRRLPDVGRVFHNVTVVGGTPISPEGRARQEAEEMKRRADGLRNWKAYFDAQKTQG